MRNLKTDSSASREKINTIITAYVVRICNTALRYSCTKDLRHGNVFSSQRHDYSANEEAECHVINTFHKQENSQWRSPDCSVLQGEQKCEGSSSTPVYVITSSFLLFCLSL